MQHVQSVKNLSDIDCPTKPKKVPVSNVGADLKFVHYLLQSLLQKSNFRIGVSNLVQDRIFVHHLILLKEMFDLLISVMQLCPAQGNFHGLQLVLSCLWVFLLVRLNLLVRNQIDLEILVQTMGIYGLTDSVEHELLLLALRVCRFVLRFAKFQVVLDHLVLKMLAKRQSNHQTT